MPIYEYECAICKEKIERILSISELEQIEIKCLKCENIMRRIISQSYFQLKGSGWYKDGYSTPKHVTSGDPINET